MAAAHAQLGMSPHEGTSSFEQPIPPSYRQLEGMVDPPLVGPPLRDASTTGFGRISAEQYEARADTAYHYAQEREKTRGLDDETVALYREASANFASSVAMAPTDTPEDPVRLLMSAGSLMKQAQADHVAPYREPQFDREGNSIDRRDQLAQTADELFEYAGALLMEEDREISVMRDGKPVTVPAPEAFKSVVKKALKESGAENGAAIHDVEVAEDITEVMDVIEADGIDEGEVVPRTAELVDQMMATHRPAVAA